MKPNRYLNVGVVATAVFVLAAYWMLPVRNGYMLRWIDEMSLFEPTRLFFNQWLHYPGGLLRWAGTWLTQLMYYPWLGSTVLIALWMLLAWMTAKAFRLSNAAIPLALLVPAALLVSVVQLDEAWLSLKSAGYVYANTLGYLFTVATVLLCRYASKRAAVGAAVAAAIPFAYFFAGFYALLGAAICAIIEVRTAVRERRYLLLAGAALTAAAIMIVPQLYYTYFPGNTVDNDYLYLKGLPELMMEKFDVYLWEPFIVATLILLLLACAAGTRLLKDSKATGWVCAAAVCCGIAWGFRSSGQNEQLRATVLMMERLDRNDWQGITGIMSRIKEPPNYTMRTINNLAILNQGGGWQSLKGYQPAHGDGRHSEKFTMTAFVNIPMNYHTGRFNQSYRWAMEHTVQYGKRVFFLKYMVKNALMTGDTALAKRYNDILLSTMFHRRWAEEMQKYIDNPTLIDTDPDFQRVINFGEDEKKDGAEDSTAPVD